MSAPIPSNDLIPVCSFIYVICGFFNIVSSVAQTTVDFRILHLMSFSSIFPVINVPVCTPRDSFACSTLKSKCWRWRWRCCTEQPRCRPLERRRRSDYSRVVGGWMPANAKQQREFYWYRSVHRVSIHWFRYRHFKRYREYFGYWNRHQTNLSS